MFNDPTTRVFSIHVDTKDFALFKRLSDMANEFGLPFEEIVKMSCSRFLSDFNETANTFAYKKKEYLESL